MSQQPPGPTDTSTGPPLTPLASDNAFREPANQVSPRAVAYWRTGSAIFTGAVTCGLIIGWVMLPQRPWWVAVLMVLVVAALLAETILVPRLRYRVHRWEVTETAVHTRSGWLSRSTRIAPLSRVQTVDSHQGAFMRLYRLSTLVVTTASAAGPIRIAGLDEDDAKQLVADLVARTGSGTGDAT